MILSSTHRSLPLLAVICDTSKGESCRLGLCVVCLVDAECSPFQKCNDKFQCSMSTARGATQLAIGAGAAGVVLIVTIAVMIYRRKQRRDRERAGYEPLSTNE